jgi:uncharacterized protein with FMN-binding domain
VAVLIVPVIVRGPVFDISQDDFFIRFPDCHNQQGAYFLPQPQRSVERSSVEIANVANNHALDFGEEGLTETAEVLTAEGIGVSGFSRIYTTEVKGVKVCSIGFTEWAYSEDQIVQAVRTARENCDLLLVSVHWGEEKNYEATEGQYVGVGKGLMGDVVVRITVADGKITAAEVIEQNETATIAGPALEKLPGLFVGCATAEEIDAIDVVSGATVTSGALKEAVKNALAQIK